MTGRVFLDTNVLVYLFDHRAPLKQQAASDLLERFAEERAARVVSTQVLQEAYFSLTSKLAFDGSEAQSALQEMTQSGFIVVTMDAPLVWRGARRSINDKLSFWDGLIVESAIAAQCTRLYTEDAQIASTAADLEVINPFR